VTAQVASPPVTGLAAALAWHGVTLPVRDLDAALAAPAGPSVVLLTDWTPASAEALTRHASTGPGWLVPVRFDGGLALVGPMIGPDASCCLACAEENRLATLGLSAAAGLRLGGPATTMPAALLAAVVLDAVARPDSYDGRVAAVRADHGTVTSHRVRPRIRGCAVCAPLPPVDPHIGLAPAPVRDPDALRAANPRTGLDRMRDLLHDWRHGPVSQVTRSERMPLPIVAAGIVGDRAVTENGYGRSLSYVDAERVALFEAVERYTGARRHAHRPLIEASFADLGPDRAVDPRLLGLPDLPFDGHGHRGETPYTPQVVTGWVPGWSLRHQREIAVPEHVAYWDVPAPTARFVYETSSGCGLGNSAVEAVLYGLFEVAERDAFLMAWYAASPLRPVAPPADDPVLPHLTDRLAEVGYDLVLFDATNDLGVPTVLALAHRQHRQHHREAGSSAPQAFFAAGAHPDPRRAMRGAAVEVAVSVVNMPELVRASPDLLARSRLLPMLADPARVRTMADHVAVNTVPEARDRYAFLLGTADDPVDWRDCWPGRPAPVHDLATLLATTVERLAGLGLDVIAVDQSDPVLRRHTGLCSAKVIVPGTLPMTFGHRNRRTAGLPRLVEVPYRLGRLPGPVRYADLPLHPHPFP
jgi:ribosomal protein S12 methylthiotransferase accessory factor